MDQFQEWAVRLLKMMVIKPDVKIFCPKCKKSESVSIRVFLKHEKHELPDFCCIDCRYEWDQEDEEVTSWILK